MSASPLRPPKQQRSQQTLDQLLDATERLLEERSFPDISIAELVAEAGVTTGAFYSRFAAKTDVLPCVYRQRYLPWLREVVSQELADGAWSGLSPRERAARAAELLCRLFETRGGLLRAMTVLARLDPAATTRSTGGAAASPQHQFLHALCDRLDEGLDGVDREELEFAVYSAITVSRESILFPGVPTTQALGLKSARLRERLQRLLESAMTTKGRSQP